MTYNAINVNRKAATIPIVVLIVSPFLFGVTPVLAEQLDNIKPMATIEPIALYIDLCLWSQQHPLPTCREVPLTPGAAGLRFVSMNACHDGQDEAMRKWRAESGPVFGFTAMAGDGYRIDGIRCGPVEDSSRSPMTHRIGAKRHPDQSGMRQLA
jgi:hypothetical protein